MLESVFVKYLVTIFISMIPIIELRGAIPVAVFTFHLTYIEAFILAVIGNCIPIFFIVKYIRPLFDFFGKFKPFKKIIDFATEKANKKIAENPKLQTATFFALYIFVAIPLPVTGAWTGSLIANFLDLPPKKAFLPLALGVLSAGIIILSLTAMANGGINYLFQHM
ncbi:MAG: small multi-drug export protein [Clostridia bacterium]|nr:small multi-drug export protein [Clostridia bacterium]